MRAVVGVPENIGECLVVWGHENRVDEHYTGRWLAGLSDDWKVSPKPEATQPLRMRSEPTAQNGQRCQFVGTQVCYVRTEPVREKTIPTREVGLIDQPSQEQSTVGVGGQWDGVEYDACRDPFLQNQLDAVRLE